MVLLTHVLLRRKNVFQTCSFVTLYIYIFMGRLNATKEYLEVDEGDKDPRTPLVRELVPPEAGLRCRADEERSTGGSPKP